MLWLNYNSVIISLSIQCLHGAAVGVSSRCRLGPSVRNGPHLPLYLKHLGGKKTPQWRPWPPLTAYKFLLKQGQQASRWESPDPCSRLAEATFSVFWKSVRYCSPDFHRVPHKTFRLFKYLLRIVAVPPTLRIICCSKKIQNLNLTLN